MGLYALILFPLLVCNLCFASISFEEIERRLSERFGLEVIQLAKQGQVLQKKDLDPKEIDSLIEKIESQYWEKLYIFYKSQIPGLLKTREWQALFDRIDGLPVTIESMSLFFAVYKSLKLIDAFSSLDSSTYAQKQQSLIESRLHDLQNMRSPYDYPQAERYVYVRFLGETVFKHQLDRAKEIGCYELSCMFGIEEVFVPCVYGFFAGQKGMMQPRMPKLIEHHRYFWFTAYRWAEYKDYLPCALGVLLFALEDIHPGNMYYIPVNNGYFKTGFFDTVGSFTYMNIHGTRPKEDLILFTPYAWIGFDYPQYTYPFQAGEKKQLEKMAQEWIAIRGEIFDYMNSGFCEMYLLEHEKQNMIRRVDHMINILQQDPETVRDLHEAFCPDYPTVQQKLYSFFPQYRTMYILFKMIWRPEYTLEKLTDERKQELLEWIANFVQETKELDF